MQPRKRLNLFAFPPETDALFSMLILASMMLALFLGYLFRFMFGITDSLDSIDITARGLEITNAYLPIVCLSGLAGVGVLGLAFLLYLRHPSQIRRRRRIEPLTEKDGEIQKHVNQMALRAVLSPPKIEMPLQGLKGADAQAFGIGNEQTIALDGGFRILRKTKPEVFNSLIQHELAHFANKDIGRSYFSDALWRSIRWLLVFPFLLIMTGNMIQRFMASILDGNLFGFFRFSVPIAFGLLLQFAFVLYISGTIWARLLRTRELYADWTAAVWGSQSGLKEILQEASAENKPKGRLALWKFHPDASERIEALEYPDILFKLSPSIVFLAGVLLSFIFAGINFSVAAFVGLAGPILTLRDSTTGLASWALTGIFWGSFVFLILLAFGLMGWLVNRVLLLQIQKQAILDLLNKKGGWMPYTKLAIPSLLLITGVELGFLMTPFSQFAPHNPWEILIELFIVVPILTCLAWWYFSYLNFVALRLSATQIGRYLSVWRSRFLRTASSVWALLFFIPGLLLSRFLDLGFPYFVYFNLGWLAFTIVLSPIVFAASWIIIKGFFESQRGKCPHCGIITDHSSPAVELCEHCENVLGEWLFILENP